jgi:hypothetical protein
MTIAILVLISIVLVLQIGQILLAHLFICHLRDALLNASKEADADMEKLLDQLKRNLSGEATK